MNSRSTPLYKALLYGAEVCKSSLPPPLEHPIPTTLLPSILNVQMDTAMDDNKNKFVIYFWSLVVANTSFWEVYMNFMIVGHTHDDIDVLFGRHGFQERELSY